MIMNGLSWFLYLADISGGIQSLLVAVAFFTLIGCVVLVVVGSVFRDRSYRGYEDIEARVINGKKLQKRASLLLIPAFMVALFSVSIPSKETFYLIGASQIGEKVIALKEAQEFGGDVGDLAKDTIKLLRNKIKSSVETDE